MRQRNWLLKDDCAQRKGTRCAHDTCEFMAINDIGGTMLKRKSSARNAAPTAFPRARIRGWKKKG